MDVIPAVFSRESSPLSFPIILSGIHAVELVCMVFICARGMADGVCRDKTIGHLVRKRKNYVAGA